MRSFMFEKTLKQLSRIAGAALLSLISIALAAQSPAPSTRIYNQAELIYAEVGVSDVVVLPSNISYVDVGIWRGLELETNEQLIVVPGQQVYFSHRLSNEGGVSDYYELSVNNLTGDSGDLENMVIYLDSNVNGEPDLGEDIITRTAVINPGAIVHLVVAGTVPVGASADDIFNIELIAASAADAALVASVSDSATLKTGGANIVINKTSSTACEKYLDAGDELVYNIEFNNVGAASPAEQTYVVDGLNKTGVLLEDDLAYSVFLTDGQTPVFAPYQAEFVVHLYKDIASEEWISYDNWNGTDTVHKVGLIVPAANMQSNQAGSFSFEVAVAETATASTVFNNRVTIDEDGDDQVDFTSNEVCNQIRPVDDVNPSSSPSVSAEISFLRPAFDLYVDSTAPDHGDDEDYVDSESFRINNGISDYDIRRDGVYIQVTSTTLTEETYQVLSDGTRQVMVTVESSGTGEVAEMALRETSPGSGVYRALRALMLSTESGSGDACPAGVLDADDNPANEIAPDYTILTENVTEECVLRSINDDSLIVTLYDAGIGAILEDAAIVDPLGFVFDSVTKLPIAGAEVVVCSIGATALLYDDLIADDLCGALGEQALDPFPFIDDGLNVPLDIQVTGDDGFYQYPFMLAGSYYLVVYPPDGYSFPSLKDPLNFLSFEINEFSYGVDGSDHVSGSEAGVFTLNALNDLVVVDLPIDPVQVSLSVSSTCEAPGFVLGADDQFSYSLGYSNSGNLAPPGRSIMLDAVAVSGVLVEDRLPFDKFLQADQPALPTPAAAEIIVQLYSETGTDNWISFASWNGIDLVDSIAVFIQPSDFGPGVSGSYTFNVRTAATVTNNTTIGNTIGVNLNGDGEPDFIAEAEGCVAVGPDATIRFLSPSYDLLAGGIAPNFFDDDDFIDAALYGLDDSIGDYNAVVDGVYLELNSTSIPTSYLNDPDNLAAVLDDGRRQLVVTVVSELTGDQVRVVVQETGYSTGVFRSIRQIVLSATRSADNALCPIDADRQSAPDYATSPADVCVLNSEQNDNLRVFFDDPGVGRVLQDAAIVDPLGVVFDSLTLQPVEGAVVSIFNDDGSQAIDPVSGDILVSQIVGPDGFYQYPRLFPGSYYLTVEPPLGYSWPSGFSPADLADSGYEVIDASYGIDGFNGVLNSGVFFLDASFPLLVVDFPVDAGGDFQLVVEKTASADYVELGGLIEYSIRVANVGEGLVRDIELIDDLPFGFRYIENTLRVNGERVDDPDGAPGPQLIIDAGDLAIDQETTAAYVLQATAGAVDGDGINEAYAQGIGAIATVVSNVDRVHVELERSGVLSDKAFVFGKVYVDTDCNNIQNDAEWPIGGVKLYMENGTYVITDENGQYSVFGIEPGNHVIKLDELTLPQGVTLKPIDNRHGADPGSRFLDLIDGEYHRADFAVACPDPGELDLVLQQLQARNESMNGDWMLDQALLFNPDQVTTTISDSALTSGVFGATGAFNPGDRREQSQVIGGFNLEGLGADEIAQEDGYPGPEELAKTVTKDLAKEGAWLWPKEDRSISGRFVAAVRTGMVPFLYLNGEKVADSQLGEQLVMQDIDSQVLAWYGLNLLEGDNLLEVKAQDPFGNLRVMVSGNFYNPGFADDLQLQAEKDVLAADGGRSMLPIDINIVDINGRLARGLEFVTLETSDGSFYEEDIQPSITGHQIRVLNGQARVHLRSSERTGDVMVRASTGSFEDQMDVRFIASQRSLIVSGIADTGYLTCSINGDGQAPTASTCEDGDLNHRLALFMKGQIRGDYFLTLSYDSEKADSEELLRDMNPNEYYPIMGDNSVRGYEAQSRSKLYARLEFEKNSLTWGDFTTDANNSYKDLSRVQRTLTGVEGVYDNGKLSVVAFASQVEDARIVVELAGNGTAMLYQIPTGNLVRNSEVVELLTMDREASGLVIDSKSLQRFSDYTIDYVTGDIRFTSAIPTYDADLNPLILRISYDQETGGEEKLVAGVRTTAELTEQLIVGGSYTRDENEINGSDISGGFLEYRPNEKSLITVSAANMDHRDETLNDGAGLYAAVEMSWDNGGRTNLTWGRADVGFTNGNGVSAGREDYRFSHQQQIGKQLTLDSEAIQGSELGSVNQSNSYRVSLSYDVAGWDLSLGSRYLDQKTETDRITGTTIIAGAGRSYEIFGMKSQVSAEYERETGNDHRERWQARFDTRLLNHLGVYGQVEQINSLAGISELSAADERVTASFGVETDWLPSTTIFNEYRMRGVQDGRELEAATGVRGDYSIIDGVKITPTVEIINTKEGAGSDSRALSLGLNDTRNENSRTNARVEARFDDSRDYYGMDISYVSRINLDWSAFVQEDLRYTELATGGEELDSTFTLGLTHRPRLDNTHHSLFMYQWKEERAEGTLGDRSVHLLSTHQNWQPSDQWILSGRVGAKYEEQPLLDMNFSSLTAVMDGRLIYDINRRFDLDVHAGVIGTNSFDETRYSFGIGLNYLVNRNLRVGIGYNLIGFDEGDLDPQGYNQHGFYINMQYKFDEDLFNWLESDANREAK